MKRLSAFAIISSGIFLFSGCTTPEYTINEGHMPYSQEEAAQSETIIIEDFSDVLCGHCKKLRPILEELKAKYPDAEFRSYPFPFLGTQSFASAIAIECAKDQDLIKGGAFENAVFLAPKISTSQREEIAKTVELDMEAYNACITQKASDPIVQASLAEGKKRGVNSTPTLFINGELFQGNRTVETLSEAIEERKTQ